MPEMTEAELEKLEKRCEAVKSTRQKIEEENEKMELELKDARSQLNKMTEGKGNFEQQLVQLDLDANSKRVAMKDAEKMFNREKEDHRRAVEDLKQMGRDQLRALQKDFEAEELRLRESLGDLGVMEFNTASLGQDIVNMHKRIEIQKEQMRMGQRFVEKLEKEKREVEGNYDKVRHDLDVARMDNNKAETDNLELQNQLLPEARAQYQREANQREEGRPKLKKKKIKKIKPAEEEWEEEGGRGGRRKWDEDEGDEIPRRRR